KSSQDASASTDLIRYSQFGTELNNAVTKGAIIPLIIQTTNECNIMLPNSVTRVIYNGASGGEFCYLPDTSDEGKEIIFTNVTSNSVTVSVSSAEIYNIVYTGIGSPITTLAAKG